MAGWENNKEIYVESVEEILDTNPVLYYTDASGDFYAYNFAT